MTLPQLKPCPDCGSDNVNVFTYENGWRHCECNHCWKLGRGEGSMLAAIRWWNAQERLPISPVREFSYLAKELKGDANGE